MKRRTFVKQAALGAVMPSLINGQTVKAVGLSPWLEMLTNTAAETNHVLVIIQMSGGNDGLNMVIPVDQYTNLAAARANILMNEGDLTATTLVTGTALHPAMTGMKTLYDEGKLKVVQGVSYPTPNFSHFRATDIWMSAANSNEVLTTGWAGRYLNSEYTNYPSGYPNTTMPDPLAIQIGNTASLTFQGPAIGMGMTISSPTDFYNFINNVQDAPPAGYAGRELTYIRQVARQTQAYGTVISSAYTRAANTVTYPATGLASQLQIVARLIKGGLKTRVYMVQTGGFDTHAGQVLAADKKTGTHATLLKGISDSILTFQRDLEGMGIQDRVLGMTFSEFGRRIKSNASLGTDHGAGAPLFVFGSRLFGGVLGVNPTIPANADVNSNVPMQFDFRSVYASLLKDWFCVDPTQLNTVMLRNFQPLRIVNSSSCITDAHELNQDAGIQLISNYPNPFDSSTNIQFETYGGHTMVQIFDTEGHLIQVLTDREYDAGKYRVTFDSDNLPAGVYYARLQNGSIQQVRPMLKVR
jgi:uncharacterized protein (DUF1501 family)